MVMLTQQEQEQKTRSRSSSSILFLEPTQHARKATRVSLPLTCVARTMLRTSSARGDRTVQAGDTVILFGGRERVLSLVTVKGAILNHKFGHFRHDDIIGASTPQPTNQLEILILNMMTVTIMARMTRVGKKYGSQVVAFRKAKGAKDLGYLSVRVASCTGAQALKGPERLLSLALLTELW